MYKKINIYIQLMDKNNNNNKNIKLQIKSFLKKISLQLHFKRVNVPTVFTYPENRKHQKHE